MHPRRAIAIALFSLLASDLAAQGIRNEIRIPDIPGYRTLKCDFHMHTVFSDGDVWPTVRAAELWRDGFDAFATTDHIESQAKRKDVSTDLNRPYAIAAGRSRELGLTMIRAGEITRSMPPGHFNALFLSDVNALKTEKWRDAFAAARAQDAFLFWNHPGWERQLEKDGITRWYPEHTELLEGGMLHGIEVVNWKSYYPEAHRWCIEKKLTMLASSDVHAPIDFVYPPGGEGHRPATLVFARENTAKAIREALFARRTALYFQHSLIGEARFLAPIFERSVTPVDPAIRLVAKRRSYLQLRNTSALPFELRRRGRVPGLSIPETIAIPAGQIALVGIQASKASDAKRRVVALPYTATNLKTAPGEGLAIELRIEVTIASSG